MATRGLEQIPYSVIEDNRQYRTTFFPNMARLWRLSVYAMRFKTKLDRSLFQHSSPKFVYVHLIPRRNGHQFLAGIHKSKLHHPVYFLEHGERACSRKGLNISKGKLLEELRRSSSSWGRRGRVHVSSRDLHQQKMNISSPSTDTSLAICFLPEIPTYAVSSEDLCPRGHVFLLSWQTRWCP